MAPCGLVAIHSDHSDSASGPGDGLLLVTRSERLRRCWHPVAFAGVIGEAPEGRTVLGTRVVLWRTPDRRLRCAVDRCPHRWAQLSAGTVDGDRLALVNPEIVWSEGSEVADEGCLSLPNWYGPVERAVTIRVRALNAEGQPLRREATGLLARAIQHEIDHLDGVIFTDRLTDPDALRFVDPSSDEARRLRAS